MKTAVRTCHSILLRSLMVVAVVEILVVVIVVVVLVVIEHACSMKSLKYMETAGRNLPFYPAHLNHVE